MSRLLSTIVRVLAWGAGGLVALAVALFGRQEAATAGTSAGILLAILVCSLAQWQVWLAGAVLGAATGLGVGLWVGAQQRAIGIIASPDALMGWPWGMLSAAMLSSAATLVVCWPVTRPRRRRAPSRRSAS